MFFCLDEPELHINTNLHGKIIQSLYTLLPEEHSQLWIATHSIGIIKGTKELQKKYPDKVIFYDLDELSETNEWKLKPKIFLRSDWEKTFDQTIGDLACFIAPKKIFFCEGPQKIENDSTTKIVDADFYAKVFCTTHPSAQFISLGGGKNEIKKHKENGRLILSSTNTEVYYIRDRDNMTDERINDLYQTDSTAIVLSEGSVENYFFADEVIEAFWGGEEIVKKKEELLQNGFTKIKEVAGKIFKWVSEKKKDKNLGETWQEFALYELSKYLTPKTKTYQKLEEEIFGKNGKHPHQPI